jgi:hypothetical protein
LDESRIELTGTDERIPDADSDISATDPKPKKKSKKKVPKTKTEKILKKSSTGKQTASEITTASSSTLGSAVLRETRERSGNDEHLVLERELEDFLADENE